MLWRSRPSHTGAVPSSRCAKAMPGDPQVSCTGQPEQSSASTGGYYGGGTSNPANGSVPYNPGYSSQTPVWAAPSPGLIGSTLTGRPQSPPAARTQSGPTYDAFECGHLGTDCGGFNPATAIPRAAPSTPSPGSPTPLPQRSGAA
jgi:hypothetical protein